MAELLSLWFDLACSTVTTILSGCGKLVNALSPSTDEVYRRRRNVLWLCQSMNEAEYGKQVTQAISQS
jgi:hypothetical protein